MTINVRHPSEDECVPFERNGGAREGGLGWFGIAELFDAKGIYCIVSSFGRSS